MACRSGFGGRPQQLFGLFGSTGALQEQAERAHGGEVAGGGGRSQALLGLVRAARLVEQHPEVVQRLDIASVAACR
jgi:hypothetical protein